MSDRLPSLSDFATGYNSAYPELWENCVGAWAPSFGPTGSIIPDRTELTAAAEVINPSPGTNYQVNGGAYCFDANVASSTYVKTNLNRANTVTALTWTFWARLHPSTAFYVSDLSSSRGFGIDNLGTILYFNYPGPANYAQIALDVRGRWVHYAYRFDGNGSTDAERIQFFVDGVQQTLTYVGATPTSLLTTTEPLQIGRRPYAVTQTPGLWDDFRAYNVALDPARIRLLASQRGIAYTPRKRTFSIPEAAPSSDVSGETSLTFSLNANVVADVAGASNLTFSADAIPVADVNAATSLVFSLTGSLEVTASSSGATSLTFTSNASSTEPVQGGGGPGNSRRRRAVYMVDDKVFDRAEDAARYLASVTVPDYEDAEQPAPRPRRVTPVAAVEIEGERLALEPIALPVSATPEFVADMVRGELQAARRKLQRRQQAVEREELEAVMAAMQMLLDDGEEIVFH